MIARLAPAIGGAATDTLAGITCIVIVSLKLENYLLCRLHGGGAPVAVFVSRNVQYNDCMRVPTRRRGPCCLFIYIINIYRVVNVTIIS